MIEVSMNQLHEHLYDASTDHIPGSIRRCNAMIMLLNDYTNYELVKSNPRRLGSSCLFVGDADECYHYSNPMRLFFRNYQYGYSTHFLYDHHDIGQNKNFYWSDTIKTFRSFVDENTFIIEKTIRYHSYRNKITYRTSRLEFTIDRGSTSFIEEKMFKHKNAFGI